MNSLTLKWGTIKGWDLETEEARAVFDKWEKGGVSMSVATHKDSPAQKKCILKLIDLMDEIWLDWEGKQVTREEAKEYILNYVKE